VLRLRVSGCDLLACRRHAVMLPFGYAHLVIWEWVGPARLRLQLDGASAFVWCLVCVEGAVTWTGELLLYLGSRCTGAMQQDGFSGRVDQLASDTA
jgi:hypothetical protein